MMKKSSIRRHRRSTAQMLPICLEDRITPTLASSFNFQTGLLSVSSNSSDAIVLGADADGQVMLNYSLFLANGEPVRAASVGRIEIQGGPGANLIDLSGVNQAHYVRWKIDFTLPSKIETSDSSATFRNIAIIGGDGDDTITGSPFGDYIDGGAGKDAIDGGRSDDLIGWDFGDSSVNGGSGDDWAFLSLDGLAVATPTIMVSSNVPTGTVTFFVDGTVMTVNSLELIDVVGGDFGGAGTTSITVSPTSSAAHHMKLLTSINDITFGTTLPQSSKPKEIVVVGPVSSPLNPHSFRFDFAKVEYKLVGGTGNDIFEVTPGRNKTTIDGGGGTDSLSVNHLGLAVTHPAGLVQVAGRAAVNHVNVESTTTRRTVYGTAAQNELTSAGVTATAVWTTVGFLEVGTVTIKNQSALPLTNVQIEINNSSAAHRTHSPINLNIRADDSMPLRVRATGGLVASVDPNPQGTPIPNILAGESAYSPRVSFTAVSIPAGGTAIATMELPRQPYLGLKWHDVVLKKGWNTSNYEFRLGGVVSSNGDLDRPIILGSLANGKSSATAGSSVAGVSADGAAFVHVSAATDLDPYVPSISPGTHVFVNNVMVDVTPAGTASGNGTSYNPVISATGRWVAFTTNATNLLATGLSDANGTTDIALRDMLTGKMNILSKTSSGLTGNGKSFAPQISADDRYVFFLSEATNLVGGVSDANGSADLFRFDTSTNQLICLSVTPAGTATGNKGVDTSSVSGYYSISAAGDVVSWFSEATDLFVTGAPSGMHAVQKKGNNHPDFVWLPVGGLGQGIRTIGDGNKIVFWTSADLSTQTGVPDTNAASDMFLWDPASSKVSALSINSSKTGMGDGPTPGSPTDAPAISHDGSTIAFTSDADNLVPGLTVPTEDGLFRHKFFSIIDRTDATSTGYGGDNHFPAISPDGRYIAWSSVTNYGSGSSTYSHPQLWVRDVTQTTENVSGRHGLNPNFATGRPFLADNGHLVFFDSQSPLSGVDTNSFFDVFASIAHESLVIDFGGSKGSPSIDIETKKLERLYLHVNNAATNVNLASRPVDTTRWVFLNGADNENNSVNIDFASGLAGVARIRFNGGAGLDVDSANTTGADQGVVVLQDFAAPFPRWRRMNTSALELVMTEVEQMSNKLYVGGLTYTTIGSHNATIESVAGTGETHVFISATGGSSFDAFFDSLSSLDYVALDGISAGTSSITLNDLGTTSGPLSVIMVLPNRDAFSIEAAKFAHDLIIDAGGGSHSIKGGTGNDFITNFSNGSTINGGAGDDTYALVGLEGGAGQSIIDPFGIDTLDLTNGQVGVVVNMSSSALQTISPLGYQLTLAGAFEGFVGSQYDDQVLVAFINGNNAVDGGPSVAGTMGDMLTFDATGQPAAIIGDTIYRAGQIAAVHQDFEWLHLLNNAPPPQVAAVIINDGVVQRSMVTSIVVAMNGPVSFVGAPAAAFELTGPGGVMPVTAVPQTVNGQTNVRLTFTEAMYTGASLPDGMYSLRVISSQIAGGLTGGDYVSSKGTIHRLFGDSNGDRTVNATDFAAMRAVFGLTGPSIFDFDGNNLTNAADFGRFRARFGITLTP